MPCTNEHRRHSWWAWRWLSSGYDSYQRRRCKRCGVIQNRKGK